MKSIDRKRIQDNVYNLIRYKTLLDEVSAKPLSWSNRLIAWEHNENITSALNNPDISK